MKAEQVYFTKNMQNHHGGMILLDGYLYGATGGNEGGRLCCLDFGTGKVMLGRSRRAERLWSWPMTFSTTVPRRAR